MIRHMQHHSHSICQSRLCPAGAGCLSRGRHRPWVAGLGSQIGCLCSSILGSFTTLPLCCLCSRGGSEDWEMPRQWERPPSSASRSRVHMRTFRGCELCPVPGSTLEILVKWNHHHPSELPGVATVPPGMIRQDPASCHGHVGGDSSQAPAATPAVPSPSEYTCAQENPGPVVGRCFPHIAACWRLSRGTQLSVRPPRGAARCSLCALAVTRSMRPSHMHPSHMCPSCTPQGGAVTQRPLKL